MKRKYVLLFTTITNREINLKFQIDAFKLWMIWKARGNSGLEELADRTMELAEFCMTAVSSREGFRLVNDRMACPNVCFWYIPRFMRGNDENRQWWELMHKVRLPYNYCLVCVKMR